MNNNNFEEILIQTIKEQYQNFYLNNRTYSKESHTIKNKVQFAIADKIYSIPRYIVPNFNIFSDIISNKESFKQAYDTLSDENSKELYIQILAFRILGAYRVKLPTDNNQYWTYKERAKKLYDNANKNDFIKIDFLNWQLKMFDLSKDGFPIKLYYVPEGILATFFLKQYEYKNNNINIKAEENDIVIDGGGCWGDTALYFANEVKDHGKVYSFEFIPKNIMLYKKNIELNTNFKNLIKLIEFPLWQTSDTVIYFKDEGPASSVDLNEFIGFEYKIYSKSIDDFVNEENLKKLDFIKLDVEGAELPILKGAETSIKKFKPKLAIAIYHSMQDLYRIQDYIHSLNLGYKFYIGHYTTDVLETVLFANSN